MLHTETGLCAQKRSQKHIEYSFKTLPYNYSSSILLCYVKIFLDVPCERGYTRKYGSDRGNKDTLLGKKYKGTEDTGVYAPTENVCRIRCDKDQECKTYEYSPGKQKCVIRSVSDPRPNSTSYEDFRWCSKSNIFSIFTLTTFQNRIEFQY